MTGNLNMGNNRVISIPIPTNDNHLTNKKYVDNVMKTRLTGNLDVGSNRIKSSFIPNQDDDIINKKYLDEILLNKLGQDDYKIIMNNLSLKVSKNYVDEKFVKNSVGYIPDLNDNTNSKCGFKVEASSLVEDSQPYFVFNSWKGNWICQLTPPQTQWIKICLPEEKKIHKIALRGLNDNRISKWALYGSEDDISWIFECESNNGTYLGSETQFFNIINCELHKFYRLDIRSAESQYPVLSYFQLFTLDELV